MKNKNSFIILFFVSTVLFAGTVLIDEGWKLQKQEAGISIYTREGSNSDFKELKAVTNFNSTLSALVAVIKDVPSHKSWIYQCEEARLIKTEGDTVWYYYHETYAPWPVSNRYATLVVKVTQDTKTKVVTVASHNIPDTSNDKSGKVKVLKLVAAWKFTPKSNGTVDAEYQLFVNPGGEIPAWLVNLFMVDGPYNSIVGMKNELTQSKYKSAKFDFIKE